MAVYTTTEFLEAVKDRAAIPAATAVTDAKILGWADAETRSRVVPFLLAKRENYLVEDYPVSLTAGTASYRIPSRVVGQKPKDIYVVDSAGNKRSLGWYDTSEVAQFNGLSYAPTHFDIQGNLVTVHPTPTATETLHILHYRRPSDLVATSAVGTITSINTGTKVVTCSNVPTTFTTAEVYDFVKAKPGHEWLAIDQAVSARVTGAGGTVTFSSTLPTDLAVGDYVCLAGQTPVPNLPLEVMPLLEEYTAYRYLKSKGDAEGMKFSKEEIKELRDGLFPALSPRVDDEEEKLSGGVF